jgi:endonuclease III
MKKAAPVILQNSGMAGQQVDSHIFRIASSADRLSAVVHSRYILEW